MQLWPFGKIPDNPSGWILTVSRNKILDTLRRDTNFNQKIPEIVMEGIFQNDENYKDLDSDLLKMMFACCHSQLSEESRIILTLKILCGFSIGEIAKALLKKENTITKTFTRAKEKFRKLGIEHGTENKEEFENRLSSVYHILYLLFNEGYNATGGDNIVREELCEEAIYLCNLLINNPDTNEPETYALMSLFLLQASRLEARTDKHGNILTIPEQDRNKWNNDLINLGLYYLRKSVNGIRITEYHLEAAIASCHCTAKEYEETDWNQILKLYERLMKIKNTPVVAVNRIVAYSNVHGAEKALQEMEKIKNSEHLKTYYLFYAIRAGLLKSVNDVESAKTNLQMAVDLTNNKAEKKYLQEKLSSLE
jgi:RNA polymerase sigma-70 factor (ECF subfamily)